MTQHTKNYYDILGVPKDATSDVIKRSYRKLAQKYHPDVNKTSGAEATMKQINEAYDILGNPEKRSHYDRFGSGPQANPYQNQQQYSNGQGFTSFEEMMAAMFRQQQQQRQQYQQQRQNMPQSRIHPFYRFILSYFILQSLFSFIYNVFFR